MSYRKIGTGWDIHKLEEGRALVLGGVEIPSEKGCLGHSDGDAVMHAIIDALLGAAGLEDIGTCFPDTDPQYKDISSSVLMRMANDLIREDDWQIVNVDCTVILQNPKLVEYKHLMRQKIAEALDMRIQDVNVKAKTAEHMLGELGTGDAVAVQAIAMIEKDFI